MNKMLRNEYSQRGDQVIAIACLNRVMSHSKRRGGLRKMSQSHLRDMSDRVLLLWIKGTHSKLMS